MASSNLGIPTNLYSFFPDNFLFILAYSLALAYNITWLANPSLINSFTSLSYTVQVDPKAVYFNVKVSLVWESKEGFSIKAFTNTHKCYFTWKALIVVPFSFFFFMFSNTLSTI